MITENTQAEAPLLEETEADRQRLLDAFAASMAGAILVADEAASFTFGDIASKAYEAADHLLAERDRRIAARRARNEEPAS